MKKNLFYSIVAMLFLVGCNGENVESGVNNIGSIGGSDTIAAPAVTEQVADTDVSSEDIEAPAATEKVASGSDTI